MERLEAYIILPFRSMMSPFNLNAIIPGDKSETKFKLYYQDHFDINSPDPNIKSVAVADNQYIETHSKCLNTELFTFVHIDIPFSFPEGVKPTDHERWLFANTDSCNRILYALFAKYNKKWEDHQYAIF